MCCPRRRSSCVLASLRVGFPRVGHLAGVSTEPGAVRRAWRGFRLIGKVFGVGNSAIGERTDCSGAHVALCQINVSNYRVVLTTMSTRDVHASALRLVRTCPTNNARASLEKFHSTARPSSDARHNNAAALRLRGGTLTGMSNNTNSALALCN